MPPRVITSPSAEVRLSAARRALVGVEPPAPVLVLGATRHAARRLTLEGCGRAAFGWRRATLRDLARALSEEARQEAGLTPVSRLVGVALVERAFGDLLRAAPRDLGRFAAVARSPGLSRAVHELLLELSADGVTDEELEGLDPELARLLRAARAALAAAKVELPTDAIAAACDALRATRERADEAPLAARLVLQAEVVALDLSLRSALEARLLAEVALCARTLVATVPSGDEATLALLRAYLPEVAVEERAAGGGRAHPVISRLQTRLFSEQAEAPLPPEPDRLDVRSAAGEAREAAEIARAILGRAREGTALDRIAVLVRRGEGAAHVLEALRRARVPAHASPGLVGTAPDPAGRAFLSLLACAAEGLSASRFAEFLSFGELREAPAVDAPFVPPEEAPRALEAAPEPEPAPDAEPVPDPDADVVRGATRAPHRWERLLVDAAVVGGLARWRRRLGGLRRALELELAAAVEDEAAESLRRTLDDLAALERCALPLLERLARLPEGAAWGPWIEALAGLAAAALRAPDRVLARLGELHPLSELGPVALADVRRLLGPRLGDLPRDAGRGPFGAVFVGTVDEVRGLSFDVVVVAGMVERGFPERIVPEPLLSDAHRRALRERPRGAAWARARALATTETRAQEERLRLRLAAGAARERVVLTYPRIDAVLGRPRVPSFYVLDALRAANGALPASLALGGTEARGGLPAPADRTLAVDQMEHDLALLVALRDAPPADTRGFARHLLDENAHLARALRFRWQRWAQRLGPADGLVAPGPRARRALARHGLAEHPYAPTTLEAFAACPYRFFLRAIQRLEPRGEIAPPSELDASVRGRLLHRLLFDLLNELRAEGRLPLRPETLPELGPRLDALSAALAREVEEELAPPSPRVVEEALRALRVDLVGWLEREARRDVGFVPAHFELAFGVAAGVARGALERGRDAASLAAPLELPIGLRLRGSIDLVERWGMELRARDYKTGEPSVRPGAVIDGGSLLQPVLYALALEAAFPGALVRSGGVTYVSARSGYREVEVPLDERARGEAAHVVGVIGSALARGELPARPADGACARCAYLTVCGPAEERRAKRKAPLAALDALRRRR